MTGLEYRFPPLTVEERERGRRRLLRAHRPHVARYYKDAEALRRDIAAEMDKNGISIRQLAKKSGESERNVRFLVDHGYAPIGTTMRILTALDVKPANLPCECITCHIEE